MQTCFLCGSPVSNICSYCKDCYVCDTHFELHHQRELRICLPFDVEYDSVKGRILVASRDIKPEEVVLFDKAAVFGPNLLPVCLGCLEKIKSTRGKNGELHYSVCPKCFFPSCGNKECISETSVHSKYECSIFAATGFKPKFKDFESPHFIYNVITILRLILEMQRNEDNRILVNQLMTHHDQRVNKFPEVEIGIKRITSFLMDDLNIPNVNGDDVIQAFGVMKTNAMTFGDGNGRGLYPIGSIISHSCVSNLEPLTEPMECLVLRSKISIKKGTELTIRYMSFWSHRTQLKDSLNNQWFFNCECERCQDPSDMKTMLSSELCSKCKQKSYLKPINPLNLNTDWQCDFCQEVRTKKQVCDLLAEFPEPESFTSIDEIIFFIKKSEKVFHAHHFIPLNYKYAFAKWVTLKGLEKIECIKLALKYYDVILGVTESLDPGTTKDKNRILLEAARLKIKILNHLRSQGKINNEIYERQHKIIMAAGLRSKN
ncbi:SET domain-containing protein SmydA-8 [Lepeophtheirus salmonis]|nr:SET domain-containing protein SmydA-8-like [Lepeophtheirus salmonis]XP_040572181.1 SET domain-containing protein SmydA-8-like [Lepeophtheirus salmonis]